MKIKNCPCCGKKPKTNQNLAVVGCEGSIICECGVGITCFNDFNSILAIESATRIWNKRTSKKRKATRIA